MVDQYDEDDLPQEQDNQYLDVSDEDFLKMNFPENTQQHTPSPGADDDAGLEGQAAAEGTEGGDTEEEEEEQGKPATTADSDKGTQEENDPAAGTDTGKEEGKEQPGSATEEEAKDKEAKDGPVTPEKITELSEFQKAILAPFKANGRTLQVKSAEEAVQLMQMGANYSKKMAGLKPGLRVLKMLENNQLLDESKIGYLIDLSKNNPAAIKKLISESGIDALSLTADEAEANEYRPGNHKVDDRELELEQVLESIKDTPSYTKTVSTISKDWDDRSKQEFYEKPALIGWINQHMENGIFDMVADEIATQRALGKLVGMSDYEAYVQVGDQLNREGRFAPAPAATQEQRTQAPAAAQAPTKPKVEDPAIAARRKAAGQHREKPVAKGPAADFNPLSMSDEEFEKQIASKLLR